MADRIADPWGGRTPYARGARWPARVDTFLADGVTEDQVERWVPTASILHSNGDGLDIAVAGGRMVGVRGRADSRINRGRLGPKDAFGRASAASSELPVDRAQPAGLRVEHQAADVVARRQLGA
jgi:hypothetical protein